MNDMHSEPSLESMWSLLQEQEREIEELKTGKVGNGHAHGIGNNRLSRAGMLKAAALGVAGVTGAGALLNGQSGIARADGSEGQTSFSSGTSTPTVSVTNSSTGGGLSATASSPGPGAAIAGLNNSSGNAYGVSGTAGSSTGNYASGVYGTNNSSSPNGFGVYGISGPGYGVVGKSTTGIGVWGGTQQGSVGFYGETYSTAASVAGVEGVVVSTSPGDLSSGVRGINSGTGTTGVGVYGSQAGTGWGMYGTAGGIGVYGVSSAGSGVAGSSATGSGVYGSSTSGIGVDAVSYSTAAYASAVEGLIASSTPGSNSSGLFGMNNGSGSNGIGVWGSQAGTGTGVYGSVSGGGSGVAGYAPAGGNAVYASGNFLATGTKNTAVRFDDGTYRKFYCLESPECWFEDFGAATLKNGRGVVRLDPGFAQSVNTEDYHVFLSPSGESKGLYISEQGPTQFVVREQGGGRSSIRFSFRIVALRKDVKAQRLEATTLPSLPPAPKKLKPPKPAKDMQKESDPESPIFTPPLDIHRLEATGSQ